MKIPTKITLSLFANKNKVIIFWLTIFGLLLLGINIFVNSLALNFATLLIYMIIAGWDWYLKQQKPLLSMLFVLSIIIIAFQLIEIGYHYLH